MDGLFDQQELEISCPHCRTRIKKTVGEWKQPGVKCPLCGADFETSQLKQQMNKVEQSLSGLQKSFKSVKVSMTFKHKGSP